MPELFDRIARVTLARPQTDSLTRTQAVSVVQIEELRMTFRVEKTLTPEPNSAEVEIWNLSEQSRGEFQERPLQIRLEAGHNNDPKVLFSGDVFWSTSRREAPNWITELQAGDGQRAVRQAKVRRSYKAGAKAVTAIREILESMNINPPSNLGSFDELEKEFSSGLVLEGPSRNELSKVLRSAGLRWSIQNGNLQILRDKSATEELAFQISQDNGLQGSPEFGAPVREGDPPTVRFKTLLFPELVPGRLIILDSLTAKGQFRIDKVTHSGDTHGNDWVSDVECRSL